MPTKRGNPLKRPYLPGLLCCLIVILLFSGCRKHCYLCHSIPRNAPCLVDLSTGQIVELTVTDDPGIVSWVFLGNASISLESDRALAIIPADDREMDRSLFCKDCQALLSELPDSGYVIADMQDPGNLSLYPAQIEGNFIIKEYEVTVTTSNDGAQIEVTKAP